ncbi:GTPase-activating protein S13 [Aphanomyces cochlioides]|nr:GTPase-activating protein S13 [Aphanomyces cochlioides]
MATQPTHRVETEHVDMIYDIKLDYHSQRIASCSSDRTVRIYEAKQFAPSTLVACLDVPCEGPVWRVAWSHPKFNVLAASTQCGKIAFYRNKAPAGAPEAWGLLSVHQTRSSSINSIEFAPHEYGLVIAAASADGVVSVVTMTQAGWVTTSTIQDNDVGCLGVSWAPYNSLGGQGMKRLVVGGCDSKVKIWSLVDGDSSQTWQQLETLPHGHNDWVRDVVWAPNAGMPCNTIASCSDDRTVVIWTQIEQNGAWTSQLLHPFRSPVYRLSWSIAGQVLSVASGEDQVTLWKLAQQPDQTWKWSQVSSISEAGATATVIETY